MLATILTIVFSAIAAIATVYLAILEIKKRRKADLSIIVLSYDKGMQVITIKNDGEADAKNISISFPESYRYVEIDIDKKLSTLLLSKGQQYNIYIHKVHQDVNSIIIPTSIYRTFQLILQWDDKAGHHQKEQLVQLL